MKKGRVLRVAQMIGLCAALCAVSGTFTAACAQNDAARQIFELTNADRATRGLQPLRWNEDLAAAAQAHAERMVVERYLSHEYPGEENLSARAAQAGAHFQAIAENIATGYSSGQVENEWMNSPAHRTNILDPRMNALGVGVVVRGGVLYAVEDFAEASEAFSAAQIESRIGYLLRRFNIDPSAPRDGALQACSSNNGYPRGSAGKLVIRFDTPDLNQLPSQVSAQLQTGTYRRASIAACSSSREQGGFTMYRVAIVLY